MPTRFCLRQPARQESRTFLLLGRTRAADRRGAKSVCRTNRGRAGSYFLGVLQRKQTTRAAQFDDSLALCQALCSGRAIPVTALLGQKNVLARRSRKSPGILAWPRYRGKKALRTLDLVKSGGGIVLVPRRRLCSRICRRPPKNSLDHSSEIPEWFLDENGSVKRNVEDPGGHTLLPQEWMLLVTRDHEMKNTHREEIKKQKLPY